MCMINQNLQQECFNKLSIYTWTHAQKQNKQHEIKNIVQILIPIITKLHKFE